MPLQHALPAAGIVYDPVELIHVQLCRVGVEWTSDGCAVNLVHANLPVAIRISIVYVVLQLLVGEVLPYGMAIRETSDRTALYRCNTPPERAPCCEQSPPTIHPPYTHHAPTIHPPPMFSSVFSQDPSPYTLAHPAPVRCASAS